MNTNAILTVKLQSKEILFNFSSRAFLDFNRFGANIKFYTIEDGIHFENSIAVSKQKIAIYKGLCRKQNLHNMPKWVNALNLRLMQDGKVLLIDKRVNNTSIFAKYGDNSIGLNGKYLNIVCNDKDVFINFDKVNLNKDENDASASLGLHCFKV